MPAPQSSVAYVHQLHLKGDICPTCDQEIPHERAQEIARRLQEREREQADAIRARLLEAFELEKTEAVEQQRLLGEQRLEEVRVAAAAAADARVEEMREALQSETAKLRTDAEAAQTRATAAEAAQGELAAKLAAADARTEARVAEVLSEATKREEEVRAEVQAKAKAEAAEQVQAALAAKTEAETANAALQAQLEAADARTIVAVEAARAETEAALAPRLSEMEAAKGAAELAAATARQEVTDLKAAHQAELDSRVLEVREALEKDKTDAVNAERQANFEEKLKLSNKVEELTRALDKKTAEDLGEGAELDLFEALKGEFEEDRIVRIGRGLPGADIEHTVMHNGRVCGRIIYDSKNHGAWRNDFVAKLKADQVAAKAEHAILSSRKLPGGARHLCVQEGVIVATPARVVAIVQIIREHIIQSDVLRLSGQARAEKTAKLYDFITSERFRGLLNQVEAAAQKLEDLQVAEKRAHDSQWRRQGEIYRSLSRVKAEIGLEIDGIIGQSDSIESEA